MNFIETMCKKFTSYITVSAIILNYKTENLTLFRETMIIQYIKQFGQNVAFLKVKSKWNVQKPLLFRGLGEWEINQALKLQFQWVAATKRCQFYNRLTVDLRWRCLWGTAAGRHNPERCLLALAASNKDVGVEQNDCRERMGHWQK